MLAGDGFQVNVTRARISSLSSQNLLSFSALRTGVGWYTVHRGLTNRANGVCCSLYLTVVWMIEDFPWELSTDLLSCVGKGCVSRVA